MFTTDAVLAPKRANAFSAVVSRPFSGCFARPEIPSISKKTFHCRDCFSFKFFSCYKQKRQGQHFRIRGLYEKPSHSIPTGGDWRILVKNSSARLRESIRILIFGTF